MCGIAGYYGTRLVDEQNVTVTLALMRRRGPDDASARRFRTARGRHACLLHSRLSIVDLDPRSNQPFQVGGKWIAFNGEVYNHVELRAELERAGRRMRTTSDTEVLLHALDRDGDAALERCEGMWAFAVFDEADSSLLLSRDRFGEKPLYVLHADSGIYFGSEVKFLAALSGRRLEVDYEQLRRYLINGYKALHHSTQGFFADVRELPQAAVLRVAVDGTETERRYWRPRCEPDESMSYADAVGGARERLIRSVELRLRADVPLAFCMSGGIDSNSLIGIAKRCFKYDVHGFTIANSDARYEESDMVSVAVRELGLRHTSIPTGAGDFLAKLRTLVRQHDAPVYTITYYAHWLLMQSIAEHGYRVSVSGTAADELFTGYYDHHLMHLYETRNDLSLHARTLAAWERHVRPVVRNPHLSDPELFVRDPGFRDHIFLDADKFCAYLTGPWAEGFREKRYAGDLLRNRMLNEMFHETVPVVLHEDDINAMYYSLENRSPFLDRDLFEFCFRIPSRFLVRDGYAKVVLRDAMRGIVPAPILDNRRKVGFNAPIFDFLDVKSPQVRAQLLQDSPIFEMVRREPIERLLEAPQLPNSQSKFLFNFLNAKLFLEEFGASRRAERAA